MYFLNSLLIKNSRSGIEIVFFDNCVTKLCSILFTCLTQVYSLQVKQVNNIQTQMQVYILRSQPFVRTKFRLQNFVSYNSRTSNIFDRLSSNGGFRFWFNPSEYFYQKGFIPLSRVPSFFKKWQVVIKFLYFQNKNNFKLTLQPTVLTTLFHDYSVGLSFQGGQEKEEKNIR